MSKLFLTVNDERDLEQGGNASFPCDFMDELKFSYRVGEAVLLVNISRNQGEGEAAWGTLGGFENRDGTTAVILRNLHLFKEKISLFGVTTPVGRISEISDVQFDDILSAQAPIRGSNEAAGFDSFVSDQTSLSAELAKLYDNRCSFSDVRTYKGAAYIIRPLDQGGQWHLSNFLFLDPEPGELFLNFAWTVGPKLQIIMDAFAVGSDVSDTVNRTAMLHLPAKTADWPDRDALAWHFEQFNKRLAAERN